MCDVGNKRGFLQQKGSNMVEGCCCMKSQTAVFVCSGILIIGWFLQLIISAERFISAVQWSRDNPEERDEAGTKVGVSGLLVIADSSEAALSLLLLSATYLRDLTKLQPWFILTGVILITYVPLSIVACFIGVTSQAEFILSWFLVVLTTYTFWIVTKFKKEFSVVSMERLL